jgi:hypothetical protein
MSPDVASLGSVRPSAVVNAEIRALIVEHGGWLHGDARAAYERLVEEWTRAVAVERRLIDVGEAA